MLTGQNTVSIEHFVELLKHYKFVDCFKRDYVTGELFDFEFVENTCEWLLDKDEINDSFEYVIYCESSKYSGVTFTRSANTITYESY